MMHFFNGKIAIDYDYTHRLPRSDFPIFFKDAPVKSVTLTLKAALIGNPGTRIESPRTFQ